MEPINERIVRHTLIGDSVIEEIQVAAGAEEVEDLELSPDDIREFAASELYSVQLESCINYSSRTFLQIIRKEGTLRKATEKAMNRWLEIDSTTRDREAIEPLLWDFFLSIKRTKDRESPFNLPVYVKSGLKLKAIADRFSPCEIYFKNGLLYHKPYYFLPNICQPKTKQELLDELSLFASAK